jgi:hypothetical protein
MKLQGAIICVSDWSDSSSVEELTTNGKIVGGDWIQTNKDTRFKASCFPVEHKEKVLEIIKHREELKKQLDESMKLVYEFVNSLSK